RDIRLAAKHLRGHYTRSGQRVDILPLYARLSQAEQDKIFKTTGGRRIVLATNVAESSLTVPGIRYVIDTGLVRISRYAPRSRVKRLPIEPVSKASADQRKGRCGRLGPGICIRLYSEEDFEARSRYTTPEIRRSDLASVLLQSKVLRLGDLESFPLPDPPTPEALREANKTLLELGAIDTQQRLTKIGKWLGKLPCDPRAGRMLWEGHERNCLSDVLIIAAALECQDVRQRPAGQRDAADEKHRSFLDPHSDFLSYLRLWDHYEHLRSTLGRSRQKKALSQSFLSPQGFREWSDLVRQLRELLGSAGVKCAAKRQIMLEAVDWDEIEKELEDNASPPAKGKKKGRSKSNQPVAKSRLRRPDGYAAIHQSLLTGLLSGVASREDKYQYKAIGNLQAALWPGSGLFKRRPRWIMAAELVETTKRFARNVAELDVEWIENAGRDLLKHSYNDPHWSEKSGAAMVYRKSTLYGLTIVPGRRVQLAPLNRDEARQLMIEHGLVAGQWRCTEAFYQHNAELIADMNELAQRTRSSDYILDRFHLAGFYQSRVPDEVFDLQSLRKWIAGNRGTEAEKALWMKPEDLLRSETGLESFEADYPNEITIGHTQLPVSYKYEPGHDDDGVAVMVPQAALKQVSDGALGWLVPGLLEEKILYLIRTLPKDLRTHFVPAPDVSKKLARDLAKRPMTQSFAEALCQVMTEHSGERIQTSSFQLEKLPDHLRMLVRVVDDAGSVIASSRDIPELQKNFAIDIDSPTEVDEQIDAFERKLIRADKFEDFPSSVSVMRGGLRVAAFPALAPTEQGVELRLADTLHDAEFQTRQGLVRLLVTKHQRSLRNQVSNLPDFSNTKVRLSHLMPAGTITEQLERLIVKMALVDDRTVIRTQVDWEARNALARREITIAAQEVAAWLPKFGKQMHAVRLLREKAPASWQEVFDDIDAQMQWLIPEGFLSTTPWKWLKEYPRYLEAICSRIEKLKSGGLPKDRRLRTPIEGLLASFEEAVESVDEHDEVPDDYIEARWLTEELRVSTYAQQLGTITSVSAKRISTLLP
ncbi:MAG TPA: ATP-dependent helicase, partial [Planctomycetaceae bacterium]|nr:ATP-dependent helicase [Planctomycetaceae bacterium]